MLAGPSQQASPLLGSEDSASNPTNVTPTISTFGTGMPCEYHRESFTIHGLWPNAIATRKYGNFEDHNIQSEELLDDMYNFWPPQSNSQKEETWLWHHEYDKHGKDFAQILQIYQPDTFGKASSQQLQEKFF
jgi:hypothetical protein